MNWYFRTLKKYAVFSGRASRAEFWYFLLFTTLIALFLGFLDVLLDLVSDRFSIGLLGGLYSLATTLPGIAVTVRRLHDIDRSGWWLLLCLLPVVGDIVLIVWLAKRGGVDDNRFGGAVL